MSAISSDKSKYFIFQIPFLPIDQYLSLYFPFKLHISELAEQEIDGEIYCNYAYNDAIIGLPNGDHPCTNVLDYIEELKRVLAYEDVIILDENYWDEYLTLVFYLLAFKKHYKSEQAEILKYLNDINAILNAVSIIRYAELNANSNTSIKLIGNNSSKSTRFELPVNITFAKGIVINSSEKIPRFDFMPSAKKLFDVNTSQADLLKIQEYVNSFSNDYSDFIEMRGTTMLVNYLRSRVPTKKERQKITNDEIRFIIKTYKAVKLTAYSASEINHLNAFRIAYNRVLGRLTP